MVAYGPWTQDADYVRNWNLDTFDADDYTQEIAEVGDETPYQNPPYQITEADVVGAFAGTQSQLAFKGGWVEYLTSGYSLIFPNWQSGWEAKTWARTFPFTNREHQYNPPNFGSTPPENAIGIDYENQPYDPEDPWGWAVAENLALRLTSATEFEGQFEDGRVLGGQPLPWASSSKVMLSVNGDAAEEVAEIDGPSFSTAPNWFTQTLDTPIDLTAYGALEPGWHASMYTFTQTAHVGGDPGYPEETLTSFGWLLNDLRFEADVRPPLYRWVYATAPYRRTSHRNDNLAGGPGRNYPPSRGQQTGKRNAGGYW